MRIFIISNVELLINSAPRTQILELYKHLSRGNNVHLFVMNAPKSEINNIKRIIHFNFIFRHWKSDSFRFRLFLHGLLLPAAILYQILLNNKPDVVYIRSYPTLFFSVMLCKFLRIPIISDVKGIVLNEILLYRKLSNLERIVIQGCERMIYRFSENIIVSQGGIADFIINNYKINKNKIKIISNGVNTDIFVPMERETALKRLNNLDIKKRYIGFIGSLDRWQGIEYLIEMMKVIKNKNYDIYLLIVGGGIERKKIARLVKDGNLKEVVLLIGPVPHAEVPYYINVCEFCFAYKSNLSTGISALKFYEYLACQKPVIASKVGGAEFIEENGFGELVEQNNLQQLINTTEKWINKSKEEKEMTGINARKFVIENYSWKLTVNKIENLMLDTIRNYGKKTY